VRHYQTDPFEVRQADDGSATLTGIAVPYDTELDLGGIREQFAQDSIDADAAVGVPLLYGHNRNDPAALLGHITRAQNQPTGLQVEAVIVDRDMAAKLRLTRPGLSVGVRFDTDEWSEDHRSVTRRSAQLAELSVTPLPAYPDAAITDVRHNQGDDMDEVTTTTVGAPVPAADYATRTDLEQLRQTVEQVEARAFTAAPEAHWSTKYGSLYEYQLAVFEGRDEPRDLVERAADTGLTSDNTGLVRAQWLNTVQRIVNLGRPGISAFGTAALPQGNTFTWPTYSTAAHTAAQSSEGAELTSAAVDVGTSSAVTVATYGGYMRGSYQLLQRSDPSFRSV